MVGNGVFGLQVPHHKGCLFGGGKATLFIAHNGGGAIMRYPSPRLPASKI